MHGSLIPALSRRVCGFYVYIVPSATGEESLLAVLSSATLECSRFGFVVSFLFEERFCRFFPPPDLLFNSLRLGSTKSCGPFLLF